MIFSVNLLTW